MRKLSVTSILSLLALSLLLVPAANAKPQVKTESMKICQQKRGSLAVVLIDAPRVKNKRVKGFKMTRRAGLLFAVKRINRRKGHRLARKGRARITVKGVYRRERRGKVRNIRATWRLKIKVTGVCVESFF